MPAKNFVGEKYGRLTVVSRLGDHAHCRCDCGNVSTPRMDKLRSGVTRSCGCLAAEMIEASRRPKAPKVKPQKPVLTADQKRAEYARRKLQPVWSTMRARTTNPNSKDYPNYGGRGIDCCEEWASFDRFFEWALLEYRPGLWLERDNNALGYSPENCSFATPAQQGNNRFNTLYIEGEFGPVALGLFARYHKLAYMTVYTKYKRLVRKGTKPTAAHFVSPV